MALIAQVLGHLDFKAGVQHLTNPARQQPTIAGELDLLGACRSDQKLNS